MAKGSCIAGKVSWYLVMVTMVLLLLVNLGVITSDLGEFIAAWWPAAVLLYFLHGFCKCGGTCCAMK